MLFLRPIVQAAGGVFDGNIETVKPFEKFTAIEGATGQCLDNLLNLAGNHVTVGEIRIVEDGTEEAFGQKVLYQHLVHGIATHVGVERRAALLKEGAEGRDERFIASMFLLNHLQKTLC